MKTFVSRDQDQFDNLSNLARQLREVEFTHIRDISPELSRTRNGLLRVLQDYTYARFQLGRLLHAYRAFYKPGHGWVAAAKVLGAAIRRDERTIYRIVEDFERAEQVAPILLEALEEQQIDPAAPKNADIIEDLRRVPVPASTQEAAEVVGAAVSVHNERKKAARESRKNERAEDFVERVASLFKARYAGMPDEKAEPEMERVLRLVAVKLGIRLARRSILPPNPPHLMNAA